MIFPLYHLLHQSWVVDRNVVGCTHRSSIHNQSITSNRVPAFSVSLRERAREEKCDGNVRRTGTHDYSTGFFHRIYRPMCALSPSSYRNRCQMSLSIALLSNVHSKEWWRIPRITNKQMKTTTLLRLSGKVLLAIGRITLLQRWMRDLTKKCWQNWVEVDWSLTTSYRPPGLMTAYEIFFREEGILDGSSSHSIFRKLFEWTNHVTRNTSYSKMAAILVFFCLIAKWPFCRMTQEGHSPVLIFHSPVLILWVVTSSLIGHRSQVTGHRSLFYQNRKYPKHS